MLADWARFASTIGLRVLLTAGITYGAILELRTGPVTDCIRCAIGDTA